MSYPLRAILLASAFTAAASAQTFNELLYASVPTNSGPFNLTLDIYPAATGSGPRPLVIFIHGGGWQGGTHNSVPTSILNLRNQGISVASIEYRLSGQAIFPAQIQDVKGAVRWLRAHATTYNLDPNRFAAWGTSAGGHLTALLATSAGVAELEGTTGGNNSFSSAIQCGVDYFGPTDIININLDVTTPPGSTINHDAATSPESALIGFNQTGQGIGVLRANLTNPTPPFPEKAHLAAMVNPVTHVDAFDPPMYIGHGDSDTSVPYHQSLRLRDALDAVGVFEEFRLAPGFGHGFLGADTDAEATAFLLAQLALPCTICRANFNCDTAIDFFDYLDFVDAFSTFSLKADFNRDGAIDFFDYLDFVDAFSTGC